ncbi:hypothetical protein BC938DRAFT_484035 [Jimgerdemannia flammicorona]|uniref:C2H2-type domain-containing protein n=1 Tax=Jimgerdemannia flammicorona TaxID=994334 RepID=A0A433QAQ3_9FUNG|nr:hypothetical protein BC938DRAFT_484035 [Jimgerdemannia flammicorona]
MPQPSLFINKSFCYLICARVFVRKEGLTRHLEDSHVHSQCSTLESSSSTIVHHQHLSEHSSINDNSRDVNSDIEVKIKPTGNENQDNNYPDNENEEQNNEDQDNEDLDYKDLDDEDKSESEATSDIEILSNTPGGEDAKDSEDFDNTIVSIVEIVHHDKAGYIYNLDEEEEDDISFQQELDDNPFYPWLNEDELWLSDLLFKNVSSSVDNKILAAIKTGRLITRSPIHFKNIYEMHAIIDKAADIVKMPFYNKTWNIAHKNEAWTGDYTLWYRNPIDAIRKLFSNPLFNSHMSFAPEKHYGINQCHRYSEIYWSNLWWELQDQLPEGSTIVPIILAIDET